LARIINYIISNKHTKTVEFHSGISFRYVITELPASFLQPVSISCAWELYSMQCWTSSGVWVAGLGWHEPWKQLCSGFLTCVEHMQIGQDLRVVSDCYSVQGISILS